jgi:hypothetical protein
MEGGGSRVLEDLDGINILEKRALQSDECKLGAAGRGIAESTGQPWLRRSGIALGSVEKCATRWILRLSPSSSMLVV